MIIVVIGVCGSGKSTLGRALSRRLAARFHDTDHRRPASGSVADWVTPVAEVLKAPGPREHLVVACRALRREQRDILRRACGQLRLVFVHPSSLTLAERYDVRRLQTMGRVPALAAQLRELEPPSPREGALFVDNEGPVETVADRVVATLLLDVSSSLTMPRRTDS